MKATVSLTTRAFLAVIVLECGAVLSVAATAAASGQPEVSISLRGLSDGTAEVGEPFRVAVRLDAPADGTTKVELAPAKGSWIDATVVEIVSADGKVVPAAARPAIPPGIEGPVALDADNHASGLWWFPVESLSGFAPGEYSVRARLVIRDGSGWKGEVVSEPAPLRVVPVSTDPERMMQRKLSHARAAMFAGEPVKAAEILNAILETEPDIVPALMLHAGLSLQGGNQTAAQVCLDRAMMLSHQPGAEPPAELHELANRIERSKRERIAAVGEVPTWTRVPRSVFAPVRKEGSMVPWISAQGVDPKTPQGPLQTTATTTPAASPKPAAAPAVAPGSNAKSEGVGVVIPSTELSDEKIIADPAGQWAATATAGTQYDRKQYSAAQATGAPNVTVAGNSPNAWCPAVRDKGMDWLGLSFAKPIQATEVRVRQNDAPGALTKVEAFEPDGTAHVWWEGVDPYQRTAVREIVWFAVRVPKTSYLVERLELTLNLASGPGYKEIDAVQLVGAAP
jgi:hypothetical protein